MPRASGYSAKNCKEIAYYYVFKQKHIYARVYVLAFKLLIICQTVWTPYGIYGQMQQPYVYYVPQIMYTGCLAVFVLVYTRPHFP